MMTAGGKNACISPRIPSGKSIRERKRKLGALLYASCVALGNLVSLNLIFCVKGIKTPALFYRRQGFKVCLFCLPAR